MLRRWTLAALTVGLAACIGCAGTAQDSSGRKGLMPAARCEFADLPVPVGFSLTNSQSFDVPPTRMFFLEYEGRSKLAQVKDFYQNNMTNQGWKLMCEATYGKMVFLDFAKDTERCSVRLDQRGWSVRVTLRSHR